ncbi:MAG: DUF4430 domain-containing protein [Proteobacteria bacterium]|nr:DUF4430 domain-containing protein [Pseudomonadota bacterium]
MTVNVAVTGGPSTSVAWTSGMNAQNALELAEDNLAGDFIYSMEYYGSSLGYLVNMINETYDTFKSTSNPFFYWEFFVNGAPSPKGIDQTILNDGDDVTFTFATYNEAAASAITKVKHTRRYA